MARKTDKIDDSITFTDPVTDSPFDATTAITMSMWIKVISWSGAWAGIIDKIAGGVSGYGFGRLSSDNNIRFITRSGAGEKDGTNFAINLNQLYHVVGWYDGANQKLYHDGVEKANQAHTNGIGQDNANLIIQGASTEMIISEIAIWKNIALSLAEIQALAKGVSPIRIRKPDFYSPIWGVASPEPDLSGNGNNGTVVGTVLADHAPVGRYTPSRLARVFPATVGAGPAPTAFFQHSGPLRIYRKNRR